MTMNTTMVIMGMIMQVMTIKDMTPKGTITIRSTLVMVIPVQGNNTTTRSMLVMLMTMGLTMLMMLAMTRTPPHSTITEGLCAQKCGLCHVISLVIFPGYSV